MPIRFPMFWPNSVNVAPSLQQGLKVGLASALSYAAALALNLPTPYIAVVSAVVVLQAHVADSLQMAAQRLFGTLTGALISLLVLATNPGGDFYTGLWLFMALTFCGFLTTYAPQFRMAGITVAIVFLMGVHSDDWLFVAVERVVEIALGVAGAVLVSLLIWPRRATTLLRGTLGEYFREAAQLIPALTAEFAVTQRPGPTAALAALDSRMTRCHELLSKALVPEARIYPRGHRRHRDTLRLMTVAERVHDHLHAMAAALATESGESERFILEPELLAMAQVLRATLEDLADPDMSQTLARDQARNQNQACLIRAALSQTETRLAELRRLGSTKRLGLPKLSQFFAFYHTLRSLGEMLAEEREGRWNTA